MRLTVFYQGVVPDIYFDDVDPAVGSFLCSYVQPDKQYLVCNRNKLAVFF